MNSVGRVISRASSMLVLGLCLAAPAGAQPPATTAVRWLAVEGKGDNPLLTSKPWTTNAELPTKTSDAHRHLGTLLSWLAKADPTVRLVSSTDYIVLLAAQNWNATFLVPGNCLSDDDSNLLDGDCDLDEQRLFGSRAVTVFGIVVPDRELSWEVSQRSRKRVELVDFLTYVLPTFAGNLLAEAGTFTYLAAFQEIPVKRVPVDIEVKATVTRFDKGDKKEATFGSTFNNYDNDLVTLGIGAAVSRTEDVSLDLATNSLVDKEISKLKTYALMGLHVPRVDPHTPQRWQWPFGVMGIEINTKRLNYGVGMGWRLPFMDNTAVSVLAVHALPDVSTDAEALTTLATRRWRAAYLIHYVLALPQKERR